MFSLFDKVFSHPHICDNDDDETLLQDGDGNIPTQELGTALRALDAYPSVNILTLFNHGGVQYAITFRVLVAGKRDFSAV